MDELLQELADVELGKQVMVTVGVAVIKWNTISIIYKGKKDIWPTINV